MVVAAQDAQNFEKNLLGSDNSLITPSLDTESSLQSQTKKQAEKLNSGLNRELQSMSLEMLVRNKLDNFFRAQRETQVELDGLYDIVMEQVEKPLIELTLKEYRGNQLKTARVLGINRNTLKRKIDIYRIKNKNLF